MGSSLVAEVKRRSRAEGRAQGRAEGRAEGEVVTARSICAELVNRSGQGGPYLVNADIIEACADAGRLHDWALAASRVSDAELVRLVGAQAPAATSRPSGTRSSRGRAPRPSRRAKPASRR